MPRSCQFMMLLLLTVHSQGQDALYTFPPNISVEVINSLQNQFKTGCVLVVLSQELLTTFKVFRLLALREISSVIVSFDRVASYSESARCGQNQPLYVILASDESARRQLQRLARRVDMSYPRWLLFYDQRGSVEKYFKNINIPFNCEFFVAERQQSQEVRITEVYRVHRYRRLQEVTYAVWTPESGLKRDNSRLLWDRRSNLQGHVLKVTAYNDPPMVTVVEKENGWVDLKGYFGDVLVILLKRMNFRVKYVEPPDRAGGSLLENGSASGMVGLLLSRRADVAVRASTMTSDRAAAVDFVFPMIFTKNYVFVQKPTSRHRGIAAFLAPFSLGLWLAVGLCIVIFAGHLALLHYVGYRCGNDEAQGARYSIVDFLFFIHGLFCQQGHDVTPRSLSCRIVYLCACLVSILLLASYSATIVSFITTPKMELPFDSFQGLLDHKKYTMGVKAKSALLNDFAEAHDPIMQRVYRKHLAETQDHPPDIFSGLKRVCEDRSYVFMASYTTVRSAAPQLPCKVVPLHGATIPENIAMAVTKNSPYRGVINYHLLELRRAGVLRRLFIHYWPRDLRDDKDTFTRVSVEEVRPPLMLLATGVLSGVLCLLAERLWRRLFAPPINERHHRMSRRKRRKTF